MIFIDGVDGLVEQWRRHVSDAELIALESGNSADETCPQSSGVVLAQCRRLCPRESQREVCDHPRLNADQSKIPDAKPNGTGTVFEHRVNVCFLKACLN